MRLWHQSLIALLPYNQLIGQHRECCAMRGLGWKKPHFLINYVFKYPRYYLYQYHVLIMDRLEQEFSCVRGPDKYVRLKDQQVKHKRNDETFLSQGRGPSSSYPPWLPVVPRPGQ